MKNMIVTAILSAALTGLFIGECRCDLTEGELLERWGYGEQQSWEKCELEKNTKNVRAGKESLHFITDSGLDTCVYFPNTMDLNLDPSEAAWLSFQLKSDNGDKSFGGGQPKIVFVMSMGKLTITPKKSLLDEAKKGWVQVNVPLHQRLDTKGEFNYKAVGDPYKSMVKRFEIHQDTGGYGFESWIDDVKIANSKGVEFVPQLVSLDLPDLDVTYIERTPKYNRYAVDYSGPYPKPKSNKQRWPKEGQQVTWIGHVKNHGRKDSMPTKYAWYANGRVVDRGTLPALKVGQETTVKLKAGWTQKRQMLNLVIDPSGPEICRANNKLEIATDALTYGFHVEKTAYERMCSVTSILGSFSAEDWLNHNVIGAMNKMFAMSVYPGFQKGAIQRVRLDVLKIYDDEGLPNNGPHAPDTQETDGVWGFGSKNCQEYLNTSVFKNKALMHELMHQLGIIDLYQMNLNRDKDKITGKGFGWPSPHGLMGGGRIGKHDGSEPILSENSVMGLNVTYGYRRGYFGEYLFMIPERCSISVKLNGEPVINTQVKIYQKSIDEGLEGLPVIEGKTNGKGMMALPNRPCKTPFTSATGCMLKDNPFGKMDVVGRNGLLLVSLEISGKTYGKFLPLADFNVMYSRNRQIGTFPVELEESDAYEPMKKQEGP